MEIVRMDRSHAEAVAELERVCFSDPWSIKSILSEVENPLSLWLVALDGERVLGYVGSQSVLGWADMMNLAVAPGCRRMGIGKDLVLALIKRLQQEKVSCLTLEVRESNAPANGLYRQLGFAQVGRRKNYYSNPKEDALILRKEWQL